MIAKIKIAIDTMLIMYIAFKLPLLGLFIMLQDFDVL